MEGLVLDNSRWQALYDRPTDRIIGRLKAGTDLFTGMKEVCNHFGVKGGQLIMSHQNSGSIGTFENIADIHGQ